MTKKEKLVRCDVLLIVLWALMLVSSLYLEAHPGKAYRAVWWHIVCGSAFLAGILWHVYLHFGWKEWGKRLGKSKSALTRVLTVSTVLALLTALLAWGHWLVYFRHAPIGGWHGKAGLLMLALAGWHLFGRRGFFSGSARRS